MDNFDFDEWSVLARTAPDEFEQRRRKVIESLISNSGNSISRLQGLQCNIDLERMRARTSLKSCLRLSNLMWDAFITFNNALNACVDGDCLAISASSHSAKRAKIIPFSTEYKPNK